jgi:threonine 3-dehydrogenase
MLIEGNLRRSLKGMQGIVKAEAKAGVELHRNLPEPALQKDEVLVEVAATSICGTDLNLYKWSKGAQGFNPSLPFVMGHECAGKVVEVGTAVEGIAVGDRVAAESHIFCGLCYMCRTGNAHNCEHLKLLGGTRDGAFAELVKLPASVCFRLPESVPMEVGALFEPAGVAVHALQRAQSVAGRNVLVCGCGPIGLIVIQLALLFGASRVFAVEPNPFRRNLAANLGASTVDPNTQSLRDNEQYMVSRRGIEVGFETSGAEGVLQGLLEMMDRESRVVTVGYPGQPVPVDVGAHINLKGVVLVGVSGRRVWDTWELLLQLIESGRLDLSWLITHRLGLSEFDDAIRLLREDSGKIIIYPGRK